jgi:origin recognition complex subunit 3
LKNLLDFISNINFSHSKNLQTAVLLTGVNQTDHLKQFEVLSQQITNNCHSIVTILESRNCPSLKSAVESLVSGIIKNNDEGLKLKRKQLTFQVLQSWYQDFYQDKEKPSIIVMVNDFEQFDTQCIKDLITILCSFSSQLPIILVIGVATAFKTLHNVLPSHVINHMDTHVFQSESSTEMLNIILDKVILNPDCPFHLSGRSFKILMDIFLFYDYSLNSFLQGYKIFMLEHFLSRPLSCRFSNEKLTKQDLDMIRRSCMSFRKFVEYQQSPFAKKMLITNDEKFISALYEMLEENQIFWHNFHLALRTLVILLDDLPKNDLGRLLRELYPICISDEVTKLDEFKECFGLLKFTSKDKILSKIDEIMKITKKANIKFEIFSDFIKKLKFHREEISQAGRSPQKQDEDKKIKTNLTPTTKQGTAGRQEMMQLLKQNAKNNPQRVIVEYEQKLYDFLDFMNNFLSDNLSSIQKAKPFNELFIFTDAQQVRRQIVGAPRGSIHNALTNPHHYLQCSCCEIQESENILASFPDLAISYKLHLECNKNINLYDWMQAFAMVIESNEEEISSEVQ